MSYGSVSLNVHKSLAMAAERLGTFMNTGEGGLHADLYPYQDNIIVQVRLGPLRRRLRATCRRGAAVEIKIGQGAKPGIGGHLPGEKIDHEVSITRMIPQGTDAISPAPHHDIYSIEDLRQLIYALKEATGYKPVGVKIAAVHNVAAIASGIVRAGADYVYLDGFRGGTGAAPTIIRDHVGIPLEIAIAVVDQRLRDEGIRNRASIIAAGSHPLARPTWPRPSRSAPTPCAIGTAALMALGCHLCQRLPHRLLLAGASRTQKPELTRRLDPEWGAERLVNLVHAWSHELAGDPRRPGRQRRRVAARQPRAAARRGPGRADLRDPGRQARRSVKGRGRDDCTDDHSGPVEGYVSVDRRRASPARATSPRIDCAGRLLQAP